jgi:hypothetical protein
MTSLLPEDKYSQLNVTIAEFSRFQMSESYVQGRANKLLDAISVIVDMFGISSKMIVFKKFISFLSFLA